jgi:hypothetical protein
VTLQCWLFGDMHTLVEEVDSLTSSLAVRFFQFSRLGGLLTFCDLMVC